MSSNKLLLLLLAGGALAFLAACGGGIALVVFLGVFSSDNAAKPGPAGDVKGDTQAAVLHQELPGHASRVTRVAFTPDGKRVLSGDRDGVVKLWEVSGGKELYSVKVVEGTLGLTCMALSPDGQIFVVGGFAPEVRKLATGERMRKLEASLGNIEDAVFSPDGKMLAVVGTEWVSRPVVIWDTSTWQVAHTLAHPKKGGASHQETHQAGFSADGKNLAVGVGFERVFGGDGTGEIAVYDLQGAKKQFLPSLKSVELLAYHPKKNVVATADKMPGGAVQFWNLDSGATLHATAGQRGTLSALVFNPTGTMLLTCTSEGQAKLWNSENGKEIATLDRKTGIYCAAFSPDGTLLALGGGEFFAQGSELKVWNVSAWAK
jgi:WD40 repeat protein